MRVLSEAYVSHNISLEKVNQLANNIPVSSVVAFIDDEILSEGRGSTKAL